MEQRAGPAPTGDPPDFEMKDNARRTIASVSNYRHRKILEMVYRQKSVSAGELASEFGVSKITIRRDLDALAEGNFVERTRGGARPGFKHRVDP